MNLQNDVIHNDVTPDPKDDEDDNIDGEIIANVPGTSLHNTAIVMLVETAK
jgi:hypothetical protein